MVHTYVRGISTAQPTLLVPSCKPTHKIGWRGAYRLTCLNSMDTMALMTMGETDALSGRNGSSSGAAPAPSTATFPSPTPPIDEERNVGCRPMDLVVRPRGAPGGGLAVATAAAGAHGRRNGCWVRGGKGTKAVQAWHKHTKSSCK